ncbi:MAG: NeuD/PglB/VioB family sugar acetyltransferase [Lachnospiraceae bacterium]|nr:NeuD/PglB/VioB family sugar acetyltransferase [Lachnospiraceae bacterium]
MDNYHAKKTIVFIGAGGQAMSVYDSLDKDKFELLGFIDEEIRGSFLERPIYGSEIEDIPEASRHFYFVCIGDNKARKKWYERIINHNLWTLNIIDKTASVSDLAKIGNGNFVGKFAIINAGVIVGSNNIINSKALIEHGSQIGDHINLSTNSTLNGDVFVGDEAYVGSCSVCNGQLTIGHHSVVGSGSVVVRDVEPYSTVVGIPARVLRKDVP